MLGDQFDLAEKFSLAGCALLVLIIFGRRLWENRGGDNVALRRILAGIVLVAMGTVVYIGYWTIWRMNVAAGNADVARQLLEQAAYFTTSAAVLTLLGYSFHIRSWVARPEVLGQRWWGYLIAYACLAWFSGLAISMTGNPDAVLADRLDTAEQVSRVCFALPTAAIYGWRLARNWHSENVGLKLLLCGVTLVALGVAGHAAGWTVFVVADDTRLANLNVYLTTPPVLLIIIGYAFHIYTWVSRPEILGRRWWAFIAGYVASAWLAGFLMPLLLRE